MTKHIKSRSPGIAPAEKNGRICTSYSIINPESLQLMTSGSGSVYFRYNLGS